MFSNELQPIASHLALGQLQKSSHPASHLLGGYRQPPEVTIILPITIRLNGTCVELLGSRDYQLKIVNYVDKSKSKLQTLRNCYMSHSDFLSEGVSGRNSMGTYCWEPLKPPLKTSSPHGVLFMWLKRWRTQRQPRGLPEMLGKYPSRWHTPSSAPLPLGCLHCYGVWLI